MRVGTRSLLFGFHAFWLHPWFVAAAWWQLHRWKTVTEPSSLKVSLRDPRLWVAFFVHDIGYWGKPNMDGPEEGERHPEVGARIMSIFGPGWSEFTLLHSRFYADKVGRPVSRLCIADKLAVCLTPCWLWKRLILLSGEWHEYATLPKYVAVGEWFTVKTMDRKYVAMCNHLRDYVAEAMAAEAVA